MSIQLSNNRIKIRGKEIRNFVFYLNNNYIFNHKVLLDIIDYPCVFGENREPVFGVFYPYYKNFKIQVANDIEFYKKNTKLTKKKCIYFVLHTIAHEIHHYFQYDRSQKTIENWTDRQAHKIIFNYVTNNPKYTILTINYISRDDIVENMMAMDPKRK